MNTNFEWNDSLVKEFISENLFSVEFQQTLNDRINKFKENKQPKPEWEIIQVASPECGLYYLQGHKMRYNDKIHSVKRLSDGELFTVGDKYQNDSQQQVYTIKEFEIRDGLLRANAVEHGFDFFEDLIKVKDVLFTTEDGISIYMGDDVWSVRKTDFYMNTWKADNLSSSLEENKDTLIWWYFSSKNSAEEFILMNKPLFSAKEVIEIAGKITSNAKSITQAAKEKLKQ